MLCCSFCIGLWEYNTFVFELFVNGLPVIFSVREWEAKGIGRANSILMNVEKGFNFNFWIPFSLSGIARTITEN